MAQMPADRSRHEPSTGQQSDPVALARLVLQTAASLRRTVALPVERDHGLPQQSLDVLLFLSRVEDGRARMSELAAQTLLTPSGLTRAVDRLCEAGLVRRQTCSLDRRGSFASLTAEGSERASAAVSHHRLALSQLLGGALDSAELERLAALLLRVLEQLALATSTVPEG